MIQPYFHDFTPHADSFGPHTTILAWYEVAVWLAFGAWIVNCFVGWVLVRNLPYAIKSWVRAWINLMALFGIVSILMTAMSAIVLRYPFYGVQAFVVMIHAHLVIGLATVGVWHTMHPNNNIFARMAEYKRDSDRFRAMVESARVTGIIEINEDKTIWFSSQAANRLFGYESGELIGRNFCVVIPQRFWEICLKGIDHFLLTGKSNVINSGTPFRLPGLTKNGKEFDMELSFSSYSFNNAFHFVGAMRDANNPVELKDLELDD